MSLPDQRPEPIAMARMLVKTMHCDEAVQQRMREDYYNPPCLRTIRLIRIEETLGKLPAYDADPWKAHEGYYPADVAEKAAKVNAEFLHRLAMERTRR